MIRQLEWKVKDTTDWFLPLPECFAVTLLVEVAACDVFTVRPLPLVNHFMNQYRQEASLVSEATANDQVNIALVASVWIA
jgi:hypothetical protein